MRGLCLPTFLTFASITAFAPAPTHLHQRVAPVCAHRVPMSTRQSRITPVCAHHVPVSTRRRVLFSVAALAPSSAHAFGFGDDKYKKAEPMDAQTIRRYKAIMAASDNIKVSVLRLSMTHAHCVRSQDPKQKAAYLQKICDLGILGPSIVCVGSLSVLAAPRCY